MDLIQAIILGIIQGLTEFLPISSTAHLRIVPALLGWADPGPAFTAVIQLGTLLAVLIYFRVDLGQAILGWVKSFKGGEAAKTHEAKMGWAVFIGTLPIVVLGFLFRHSIEGPARSLIVVGWALIGMAILLAAAEFGAKHKRTIDDIKPMDGLIVGLFQCIALIPGASRSGSTITGGLFDGLNRTAAARFSFLLSVPSVFAAAMLELVKQRHDFTGALMMPAIVATIFAFVVGYGAIGFLMKFLQTQSVMVFVIYRVVLGALILFLVARGTLDPMAGVQQDTPPSNTPLVRAVQGSNGHVVRISGVAPNTQTTDH